MIQSEPPPRTVPFSLAPSKTPPLTATLIRGSERPRAEHHRLAHLERDVEEMLGSDLGHLPPPPASTFGL